MSARALSPLLALTLLAAALAAGCGGSSTSTATTPPASPSANLSSTSLTFATTTIGTTTAAQPIVLSNPGAAGLSITSISTSGDFAQTNNCPATLPAAATCIIQIAFGRCVLCNSVSSASTARTQRQLTRCATKRRSRSLI